MINLSNDEALNTLKEHDKFPDFLKTFDKNLFPGVTLEQAFTFISTGVLVEGMNLDSALKLMDHIKIWASSHSHGGLRTNSGRKKSKQSLRKITFSVSESDIDTARKVAERQGVSLQALFREWLRQLADKFHHSA